MAETRDKDWQPMMSSWPNSAVQLLAGLLFLMICSATLTEGSTWTSPNITQYGSSETSLAFSPFGFSGYLLQLLEVTSSGTLFAFSMVFQELSPVDIMVWRQNSGASYTLIWKLTVTASQLNRTEFVYAEAKLVERCAKVKVGDWIGLYSAYTPYPVARIFGEDAIIWSTKWTGSKSPDMADVVSFPRDKLSNSSIQLPLPLQVLFAAYVLQDSSSSSANQNTTVACPRGLIISSSLQARTSPATTTVLPVTGIPGKNGEMGPVGATGLQGSTGMRGAAGPIGLEGSIGNTGPTGPPGSTGQQGDVRGEAGVQGPIGILGLNGTAGATGATGPSGDRGPLGLPGANLTLYIDNFGNWYYTKRPTPNGSPDTAAEEYWNKSDAVMGIYIWLAVATGVAVVILILLASTCAIIDSLKDILHT